jgi:hypothetical protein
MNNFITRQPFGPTINRVGDVMAHTSRFAFCGVKRLAQDSGVSRSTISSIINGSISASSSMVARITGALERELGFAIDPRNLFAEYGGFLTPNVCEVCHCTGCLPARAWDEFGDIKVSFAAVEPGHWVTSKYPSGYQPFAEVTND